MNNLFFLYAAICHFDRKGEITIVTTKIGDIRYGISSVISPSVEMTK